MSSDAANLPVRFDTIEALEDFMTSPSAALAEDLATIPGDILVLGSAERWGRRWRGWPSVRHRRSG